MVTINIAGLSNCHHYARVELITDYLAKNLPAFNVCKHSVKMTDWSKFKREMSEKRHLTITSSPAIWRRLYHSGGKGLLFKSEEDYYSYIEIYYGIKVPIYEENFIADVVRENVRLCYRDLIKELTHKSHIGKMPKIGIIGVKIDQILLFIEMINERTCGTRYDIRIGLLSRNDFETINQALMGSKDFGLVAHHESLERVVEGADFLIVFDSTKVSSPKREKADAEERALIYGKIGSSLATSKSSLIILVSPSVYDFSIGSDLLAIVKGFRGKDVSERANLMGRIYGVGKIYEKIATSCIARLLNIKPKNIRNVCIIGDVRKSFNLITKYSIAEEISSSDISMEMPIGFTQPLDEIFLLDNEIKAKINQEILTKSKKIRDFPLALAMFDAFICFVQSQNSSKQLKLLSLIQISTNDIIPEGYPYSCIYKFNEKDKIEMLPMLEYLAHPRDNIFIKESIECVLREYQIEP